MILSYEEAIKEYGSDYKLKKAIDSGVVFKIENGIYSSRKYNNELEVILKNKTLSDIDRFWSGSLSEITL